MLRKTSVVTTEHSLMADYSSIPSPTENHPKPTPSIFLSPRLFSNFASKGLSSSPVIESVLSPTSILDTKLFSALRNPFWSDSPKSSESKTHFDKLGSKGVGLGIVDELVTDEVPYSELNKSHSSKMVLFGSELKIQIPPLPLPSSVLSPAADSSPSDFGIKTRSSQKSPVGSGYSGLGNPNLSPRVLAGCLSATEMEQSEDYTRVITHGPNPKTTHIFDNCIVESSCGVVGMPSKGRNEYGFHRNRSLSYPSESFLSFCYNCKKNLGHGKDIYMYRYRGEKAFCSSECRHKEMMLEEEKGMEKMESESSDDDDVFVASP